MTVSVLRPASESSLQKIIDLIHAAGRRRAPSQRFTDRFLVDGTLVAVPEPGVCGLLLAALIILWHRLSNRRLLTQS